MHEDNGANRKQQHEQKKRRDFELSELSAEDDQGQDNGYYRGNYRECPPDAARYRLRRKLRAQSTSRRHDITPEAPFRAIVRAYIGSVKE